MLNQYLADLNRGFGQDGEEVEAHPFAHPFYWASFVLTDVRE